MPIRASFINDSESHSAIEFAGYFRKMVGDGVFAESGTSLMAFTVQENETVHVHPGTAYVGGVMVENTTELTLTPDTSASTRVDRVVVHVDQSTPTVDIRILKGTEGTSTPPSLMSGTLVKEICLAEYTMTANGPMNLRDTRGDDELCGYVRNILGEIDTTGLFDSWQTAFETVYEEALAQVANIQDYVDETLQTLQNDKDANAIINGNFIIDQRKGGSAHSCSAGQTYTVDRWIYRIDGTPTAAFSVQQRSFGDPSVNNQPTRALQITTRSMDTEGMGSLAQFIERGAEQFGGQTVTVSFLAYATTPQKLAVNLRARYTSTDAENFYPAAKSFDVTNAWTRHTVQIAVPKRLCDDDNSLKMSIFTTWAGSEANARFGTDTDNNVANTVYIADVVVSKGTSTPIFHPRHEAHEMELCRRYYRKNGLVALAASPMNTSTRTVKTQMLDFSGMRKAPTVTTTDKAGTTGRASWEQVSGGTSNGHAVSVSSNNDGFGLQFVVQPASTSQAQAASIIFGSIEADAEVYA